MAVKSIDPDTGLELTTISPSPPIRAVTAAGGMTPANAPGTPPMLSVPAIQPLATKVTPPAPIAQNAVSPTLQHPATGKRPSVLDSVLFSILGTPEQLLSDAEVAKKESKRNEAGALSKAAAENPGESFMGIPSTGGSSLQKTLGTIVKLAGAVL